jgi:hypothetical protein
MKFTIGDTVTITTSEGEAKTYIELYELINTKVVIISIHRKNEIIFVESLTTGERFWIPISCVSFETRKIQIDLGEMYTTYIYVPEEIYERFIIEKPKIAIKAV